MDALTKFLNRVAYKFDKGYPDMNNPKDKALLFELAGKYIGEPIEALLTESQPDYDTRIRKVLGLEDNEEIPTCQTPLKLGQDFNLEGSDEEIWSKLYPTLPLKKGSDIPTAGAGKGEIATYWAFQYNVNKHTVTDSRKGEDPDLTIDGYGCEIKSYDTSNITLGKFAGDKDNVTLLNKVFSILTLFSEFTPEIKITANPGNFKAKDVTDAFTVMGAFEKNNQYRDIDLFKPLYSRIDALYSEIGLEPKASAEEGAAKLLKQVLKTKLLKKPMMGKEIGFILNVGETGQGKFYTINEDVIDSLETGKVLNGVYVSSSELGMNFNRLFK